MIKKYLLLSVIMVLIDSVYLYLVSGFFNKQVKLIQGSEIKLHMPSTILCYLFLSLGFYYFLINKKSTNLDAFLLGLVIYGVYETTNKAILRDWKWESVIIDTIWGGTLFFLVKMIFEKITSSVKI